MIIVDSHCHLDDERYESPDHAVSAMLARAADAGVKYVQTICTTAADFDKIHPLAEQHENLFCSFGIHPHSVEEDFLTVEEIKAKASLNKVIAIGETGLDYYYDNAPRDIQKESFRRHLQAARELNLPVIIHTRDAEDDTMEILNEAIALGQTKLLFHCFSSEPRLAEYAVEKGIYMSASGIITFKKSESVREGFALAPLHLLLVETDAPYLAPMPHRGKINEPAWTRLVLEKLAEIKEVSAEELAEATTNNFFHLFDKAKQYVTLS